MARGLSELQREILKWGYLENERRRKIYRYRRADVGARDVLILYYKFKPVVPVNDEYLGQKVFSRKLIGLRRYKAAMVAVVKSFNRLCDRGLAERRWAYGIKLTEEGERIAQKLLADDIQSNC